VERQATRTERTKRRLLTTTRRFDENTGCRYAAQVDEDGDGSTILRATVYAGLRPSHDQHAGADLGRIDDFSGNA
jgi:hypothetical protein